MKLRTFAWLECVRKPAKNIILYTILTVIFTGTLVGLRIYMSTWQTRKEVLHSIGAFIELSLDEGSDINSSPISSDMINRIMELPYVVGVNQTIAEYAIPVNFKNVKEYKGEKPDPNDMSYEESYDIAPDNVVIDANIDNRFLDLFRLNQARVIDGTIPDSQNKGLMVEKHLAEVNSLKVGNKLTLTSSLKHEVAAEIIGVYETDTVFQITKHNSLGEGIFAMSPYNRIYASLDIGAALYNEDLAKLNLDIIIDSPEHVDVTGKSIKSFDWDWKSYSLYNMTETFYQDYGRHIESLSKFSKIMLFYVLAIGAIFLSIVLTIFSHYYDYDSGILLSMGAQKRMIIGQYFLATMYITLTAVITAIGLVYTVATPMINSIISSSNSTFTLGIGQFNDSITPDYSIYLSSLGFRGILLYIITIFSFLILSCIPPIYHVMRFKPREILSEKGR